MTSCEKAKDSSKPSKWVLHSTDTSIANGQISLLALFEIPLAITLYGTLAYFTPWPWFSLLACLAAPVLLLRSEASIRRGKVMLWRYARRKKSYSKNELALIAVALVLVCYWVSYALAKYLLGQPTGWVLFLSFGLIVLIAIGCAGAAAVSVVGEVGLGYLTSTTHLPTPMVAEIVFDGRKVDYREGEDQSRSHVWRVIVGVFLIVFLLASLGAVSGAGAGAGSGVGVVVGAGIGACAVSFVVMVVVGVFVIFSRETPRFEIMELALFTILPFVTLGLLARITWIRVLATLRNLSSGLPAFSNNWRESVAVVDCWHPPALLPGAEQVNISFSVRNLIQRCPDDSFTTVARYFLLLSIYLPAMLYRWNIKASTWLWGPLAFALRPTVWADDETMRETMSKHTSWPLLALMLTVALGLGAWLLGPWLPADITSEVPAWVGKLAEHLTAPALNVRTALLVATFVAWSCLLWFAYSLRSAHDKPLGDADNYKKYDDILKERFRRLAKPVRASSQWTAALAILTVWAYALKWALNRWPQDLEHLVWDWLKPWL